MHNILPSPGYWLCYRRLPLQRLVRQADTIVSCVMSWNSIWFCLTFLHQVALLKICHGLALIFGQSGQKTELSEQTLRFENQTPANENGHIWWKLKANQSIKMVPWPAQRVLARRPLTLIAQLSPCLPTPHLPENKQQPGTTGRVFLWPPGGLAELASWYEPNEYLLEQTLLTWWLLRKYQWVEEYSLSLSDEDNYRIIPAEYH